MAINKALITAFYDAANFLDDVRSTYPAFSRRPTVCVRREREWETWSARVDMRSRRSGASATAVRDRLV